MSPNTVTVKCRQYDQPDTEGVLLGEFTPDALDGLLDAMQMWSTVAYEDPTENVVGQFTVGPLGAWFEIIVGARLIEKFGAFL